MADNNKVPTFYDIVKLCRGGLILNLPAYDSSLPDRRVEFGYKTEKIRVPRTFALGVFVNSTLENLYKEGYFKVEPSAVFTREVSEIFYPINKDDIAPEISDAQLLEALKKGNRVAVKDYLTQHESIRDRILTIARENVDDLSGSMIKFVEDTLNVSITIEDEQE